MVTVFRPEELSEALRVRKEKEVLPFAGGTDLMVQRRNWAGLPPLIDRPVLFLDRVKAISGIRQDDGDVVIGATTTLSEVCDHSLTTTILRTAVQGIAAPAIRNRGTLGGNICNASPAADSLPALYVLNARLKLQSVHGERIVAVKDFFSGPGESCLRDDELLTEIIVPCRNFNVCAHRKVGTRKANALAKLSFAALANVRDNEITGIRIAFGAVGPKVIRSVSIEKSMEGRKPGDIDVDIIVSKYSKLITPIDDQRSTSQYRKKVSLNLLRIFLINSLKEIKKR